VLVLQRGLATDVVQLCFVLKVLVDFLLAGGGGDKVTFAVALVNLAGAHDVVDGVFYELVPVG
jgi:hypothetical protein